MESKYNCKDIYILLVFSVQGYYRNNCVVRLIFELRKKYTVYCKHKYNWYGLFLILISFNGHSIICKYNEDLLKKKDLIVEIGLSICDH